MVASWKLNGAATDPARGGEEKMIIRSEKVGFVDILRLLFKQQPFGSYHFVDAGRQNTGVEGGLITPGQAVVALSEIIQKVLLAVYYPVKWVGAAVVYLLNFMALNGGLLGIIRNIFSCKLVIPHHRAPYFRSIIALIDGRTELKPLAAGKERDIETGGCVVPLIQQQYLDFEVTVMASKIAYENPAYIENVVNNVWKFKFVGFYNCTNKFIRSKTTQAFVMTGRGEDARMVVVAFRGTEPFDTQDWATDVNLSWLGLGGMGRVHVGFLKALGLQEEDGGDAMRAFPRAAPNGADRFAYYELRDALQEQLRRHPAARAVVTGHSLGGTLAAVFLELLALHGEVDILGRLLAVHTNGQPRVGDAAFARASPAPCSRMVYRYDVVPRVPFDAPPLAEFRHSGACVFFDGWYHGRVLAGDALDRNYFNPLYLLARYGNAWGDLVKATFLWVREGADYREGAVSLLCRAAGFVFPGIASHSPRDYVNAVRLSRIKPRHVLA